MLLLLMLQRKMPALVSKHLKEETDARKEEMIRNLREEIKRATPCQSGRSPTSSNPTFVGSINPQRGYSHHVQGTVPQDQDPNIFPMIAEAHRVTDQFCEQYQILKAEVEILEAENIELCRISRVS